MDQKNQNEQKDQKEQREWLAKVSNQEVENLSINAIATKSGIVQSTLSRRIDAGGITADQAIKICRAYSADVIQGLLDLGFITEADLKQPAARAMLKDAKDEDLIAEIGRRIARTPRGRGPWDEPVLVPTGE